MGRPYPESHTLVRGGALPHRRRDWGAHGFCGIGCLGYGGSLPRLVQGWPLALALPWGSSHGPVPPSPSPQVQLSESKRELKELRAALKVAEKEKEQLQEEKQVGAIQGQRSKGAEPRSQEGIRSG